MTLCHWRLENATAEDDKYLGSLEREPGTVTYYDSLLEMCWRKSRRERVHAPLGSLIRLKVIQCGWRQREVPWRIYLSDLLLWSREINSERSACFALHPPLLNDVLLRALWTFFSSFHDCHSDADLGKASTYAWQQTGRTHVHSKRDLNSRSQCSSVPFRSGGLLIRSCYLKSIQWPGFCHSNNDYQKYLKELHLILGYFSQ
jgi:hypothetical protein